jgi:hypothetical protein
MGNYSNGQASYDSRVGTVKGRLYEHVDEQALKNRKSTFQSTHRYQSSLGWDSNSIRDLPRYGAFLTILSGILVGTALFTVPYLLFFFK